MTLASTIRTALLLAALLSLQTSGAFAATTALAGSWSGSLAESGHLLAVRVTFERGPAGQYAGTYSSDTQAVMDYPFDFVTINGNRVAFSLGEGATRFSATLVRDPTMSGTFDGDEGKGTFVLHRTAARMLPYRTENVTVNDRGVILNGTLCVPVAPGRHPGVVLLHGSGPEIRWGTNRFIADRLARGGIAALVYDKRGSGASSGDWRTVGYDALADDAIAGMVLLSKRSDIDSKQIGLWGHSQGGFIAPLIAERNGRVAFIVAADSNASTNREQDVLRVRNEIRDNGWIGRDGADALALYKQFLRVASDGGEGYDDLARAMQREKARPWVRWMGIPPRTSWLYKWYPLVASYDSRTYWKTVRVPVLLVYGQHDELSDIDGSVATIRALVRRAGGPPVTTIILPGAPHTLHVAPVQGRPFFWWHIANGYPGAEVDWIRAVTHRK